MVKKVVERYPAVEEALVHLAPLAKKCGEAIDVAGPYALQAWGYAKAAYDQCPIEILTALLGLMLCFFGGAFVTTIAAAEAFRLCGGSRTMRHLRVLWRDYMRFQIAQRQRRRQSPNTPVRATDTMVVLLRSVRDPDRLSSSVSGLYTAFLAMFTTLRLQFARTITLGAAIGESIKKPVGTFVVPSLERLVEPDFRKWVSPATEWGCRFLGVTIAFYAQRVLAAVQSSLRGGEMCVRHTFIFLRQKGVLPSTRHDATFDAVGGYVLSALGLYCQLCWGFTVPFPLSILAWPFSFIENTLIFFV
eukprot:TRINITY_DN20205_c0_g1_i2.p1 TRINITY_DN20205_c0_g1~~TRINITY_DN20205_c0_g1_i2.p1  ORF type:complete len:321 (+),score=119.68 TRINITY_DN20205_c0_g1_i2:57-965(+)